MKIALIVVVFALSSSSAFAGTQGSYAVFSMITWGTEDVNAGTICMVKDITVLTQTPDDCAAIGGEATHTLTQTAVPIAK